MVAYTFNAEQAAGIIAGLAPGSRVIVLGCSQESGVEILQHIIDTGLLQIVEVRRTNGKQRALLEGNRIIYVTSERGNGVRGRTANLLITEHGVSPDAVKHARHTINPTGGTHIRVHIPHTVEAPIEAPTPEQATTQKPDPHPNPEGVTKNPHNPN